MGQIISCSGNHSLFDCEWREGRTNTGAANSSTCSHVSGTPSVSGTSGGFRIYAIEMEEVNYMLAFFNTAKRGFLFFFYNSPYHTLVQLSQCKLSTYLEL